MDDNAHTIAKHFIDNLSPGIAREAQELARAYLTLEAILPVWRDIADAPKDGTRILGFIPRANFIAVCIWVEADTSFEEIVGHWIAFGSGKEVVTHFMPLPAAPQGEQPKKEI